MSFDGEDTISDAFDAEFAPPPDVDPEYDYALPYESEAAGLDVVTPLAGNSPPAAMDEAPPRLEVPVDEFDAGIADVDFTIPFVAGPPPEPIVDNVTQKSAEEPQNVAGPPLGQGARSAVARLRAIIGPAFIDARQNGMTIVVYTRQLDPYVRRRVPKQLGLYRVSLIERGGGQAQPAAPTDMYGQQPYPTSTDPYMQQAFPGYDPMQPQQAYPTYPGYPYPAPAYYPMPMPMMPGMGYGDPYQEQMAMMQQLQMAQMPDGSLSYVDGSLQVMGALCIGGAPQSGSRYIFSLDGVQHVVLEGVEATPERDAEMIRAYSWAREQGVRGRAAPAGTVGCAETHGDTWLERDGASGYKRLVFTDPPRADAKKG